MKLSSKLKQLRESKQYLQKDVANAINIDRTTYIKYEKGTSKPDSDTITALANFFEVSADFLLETEYKVKGVQVPVFGHVAAGIPIDAIEDILDYEEISESEARGREFFALKIKGRSMEPRIYNGDIVIVRRQSTVDNGDIAIILVNGDEATCKKIKKTPEGVMLIPLNPDYDTMFYSNNDIEQLPVAILGKVVEVRSKFEVI